jgi:hypothetical protein
MKITQAVLGLIATLCLCLAGCGSDAPAPALESAVEREAAPSAPPATVRLESLEALLERIETTLADGDALAYEALVHLGPDAHVSTRMEIREEAHSLARPGTRTFQVEPIDEEHLAEVGKWGRHYTVPPKGLIVLKRETVHKDESGTMTESTQTMLGYAEVDGSFRLLPRDLLPDARAARQSEFESGAMASELDSMVEEALLESGQALPEGGGDPGAVLLAYLDALEHGSLADVVPFRPILASFIEPFVIDDVVIRPAPSADEQEDMLRGFRHGAFRQARVTGGWQGEEAAILRVEGIVGDGWPSAGYVLMEREEGRWTVGPERTIHE